jgi:hypothetical protein
MADPFDPLAPSPYPTVAEVTTYLMSVRPGSPWETLTPEQQAAAAQQATIQMENLCWEGYRCDADQSFAWPRTGAICCETELSCDVLMPAGVQVAFCELAAALGANPMLLFGSAPVAVPTGLYVSDQRLGDLGQSFAAFSAGSGPKYGVQAPMLFQKLPWMGELLGCWVVGSWGASRVLSRC